MPTVSVNGFTANYEEVGSGEPFVYIAGTRFDSAQAWVPYMKEHAAGFRVILPDPRGLGGSQRVAMVQPSDWVEDLAGLLDAIGVAKVHLAAETLGTRIATKFAELHPDRVSTLILNGAIAYSSASGDAQRASTLSDQRKKDLEFHHGADWEAVNAFYQDVHAQPAFHEYFDLRKVAPNVQVPALLMRGDGKKDPVHPALHSVELHELFPQSWLAIFPNTEFNALRGRPERAWTLIREFTSDPTAGAASRSA